MFRGPGGVSAPAGLTEFVLHKSADQILESLASYCHRIKDSGHMRSRPHWRAQCRWRREARSVGSELIALLLGQAGQQLIFGPALCRRGAAEAALASRAVA